MMNKKMLAFMVAFLCIVSPVTYGDCAEKKVEDKSGGLSLEEQEMADKENMDIIIAPPPPPLAVFDLPSISLTTSDEEPHFVKMTIAMGYEKNDALTAELVKRKDQIRHMINILVQGKTFNELNSVEGAINLAEEIKAYVNALLISGKIKEVYFREFIIN